MPLLMCTALQCYYAACTSQRRTLWTVFLGLILLVGPWYREFVGLSAVLVLFLEARRCRGRSVLTLVAGAGFFHALFPTAILHVTFFPGLPVRPVYARAVWGKRWLAGCLTGAVGAAGPGNCLLACTGAFSWTL